MRTIFISLATLFFVGSAFLDAPVASAQAPSKTELRQDIENLIELDPDIAKYLPRWRILEADLKTKLTLYFQSQGLKMTTSDTIIVTSAFDMDNGQQDLLKIEVLGVPGAEMNGRAKIESEIGTGLYQEIADRDRYAHAEIERESPLTESTKDRVPNVLYPTNAQQFIAISAFRQALQLGTTGARVEHLIGSDEIGYPFWSGGQGKILVDYPIIRQDNVELRKVGVPDILKFSLGVGYRLKFGGPDESLIADVFSPRKLNGAIGAKAIVKAEYRLPQINDLGIGIYTELPFNKRSGGEAVNGKPAEVVYAVDSIPFGRNGRDTRLPVRLAYFQRTIAQGNIFWENWLNNYEHYIRFSVGASYQEVAEAALRNGDLYIGPDGVSTLNAEGNAGQPLNPSIAGLADNVQYRRLYHPTEVQDWIYIKAEYLNQSDFPFGASAQLSNRNILLTGFVPIVPNWLFLEAKYSTPLLRSEAAPWEQSPFIVISPILRFMLD